MLSSFLKGIGHPSTIFTFFDKATRLTAGPQKSHAIQSLQDCQTNLSLFAKL
jgi:hypothetical protein